MYCFYSVINFHWGKLCKQQKRMEYRIRVFILFVLYHHTMYVISLSNISIKGNFKQIARVELKCVQYSEGDYILTCIWRHVIFSVHSPTPGYCVLSHIPMVWRHAKVVRQRTSRATPRHSFINTVLIQHLVSDALYQTVDFR